MTTMKYRIYLTDKDGHDAIVVGEETAIHAVEKALAAAGWKYHEPSGSWDEGFYDDEEGE
jgi:hypothetical protein